MALNIAIVGFGRMAQRFYAPALQRLAPDARYAIADPSEDARGKALGIFPGASCFTAVEKLAELALDAALIASSPATHFHAWHILAARGVPVFIEKPFPLAHEINPVVDLARKRPLRLMINFNRRFWQPYQRLLERTGSGVLGTLRTASIQLIVDGRQWNRPPAVALQDLGGHAVDFAIRLFGPSPVVVAATDVSGSNSQGVSLTLQWPDGRSVNCRVGYGKAREAIRVQGSLGTLAMNNPMAESGSLTSQTSFARFGAGVIDLLSMLGYALRPARRLTRSSTYAALGAFLSSIRTGDAPKPNLDDAIQIAIILAAAEESLFSKSSVRLANFVPPRAPRAP